MKVGFTGTRRGMTTPQFSKVAHILAKLRKAGFAVLVHGDCVGADAEAHGEAVRLALDIEKRPSNLDAQRARTKGGKTVAAPEPPLDRNKKIVDDVDCLIAAPAEPEEQQRSGTWATIRYARATGKPVFLVKPDGVVSSVAKAPPPANRKVKARPEAGPLTLTAGKHIRCDFCEESHLLIPASNGDPAMLFFYCTRLRLGVLNGVDLCEMVRASRNPPR